MAAANQFVTLVACNDQGTGYRERVTARQYKGTVARALLADGAESVEVYDHKGDHIETISQLRAEKEG